MQYDWKTCLRYQTILMLLSIEEPELHDFILGTTPQICKSAKYKPVKHKG
jgi:hypothetical protein